MSNAKITILHVPNRFGVGGSERQQTELIKRLPAERYAQIVATMGPSGPFVAEIEQRGIEVIEFPFTSFCNRSAVRHYRGLARLIRQRQVHLVHCHDFYSNVFGAAAARMARMRRLITSRRDTGMMFSLPQRFAQRLAYACSAAVVTNSELVRRLLVERELVPEQKVRRVYNGIDAEQFAPREPSGELAASLGLPAGGPIIGSVGNLHPWKGHDTFIRAAARIRAARPDARFLLVGAGAAQAGLENLAREAGVGEAMVFAGTRADIPELLALMSVFVQPSPHESLPNAVLEAMACARPVVATSVGGVPELVNNGVTGFLVPPNDPAALAEKVLALLADPALAAAMAGAARRRAVDEFSCDRLVRNMEALYEDVLAGHQAAREAQDAENTVEIEDVD